MWNRRSFAHRQDRGKESQEMTDKFGFAWCPHTFEPPHLWALAPTCATPTVVQSISPSAGDTSP